MSPCLNFSIVYLSSKLSSFCFFFILLIIDHHFFFYCAYLSMCACMGVCACVHVFLSILHSPYWIVNFLSLGVMPRILFILKKNLVDLIKSQVRYLTKLSG